MFIFPPIRLYQSSKITDVNGLAPTAFLNTQIGDIEIKFFVVSKSVKKTAYDDKITDHYATKIVNAYIAYGLDAWPKIPFREFTLKNCLFSAIIIAKNKR